MDLSSRMGLEFLLSNCVVLQESNYTFTIKNENNAKVIVRLKG